MSENSKSVPSAATKQQLLLFPDDNRKTEKKSVERQPQHDAIKRKTTFKAIKPNSLKNSSEIDGKRIIINYLPFFTSSLSPLLIPSHTTETSNLLKYKNSHLGKSAPCKYAI